MGDALKTTPLGLATLDLEAKIVPEEPKKCINDGDDLTFFLQSKAFVDITTFLAQLNRSMVPCLRAEGELQPWLISSVHIMQSPQVVRIKVLIQTLATMLRETPAETGPRRFGNAAFRKWFAKVQERTPTLLQQAIPENVWSHVQPDDRDTLIAELGDYLLGSFGSAERLDYGTGHELSFIAFLAGVWKLNGFAPSEGGNEERGIVVAIIEP